MKKILIIEDDIAYLRLLKDQLTKNEYYVLEAKNAKEGLLIAKLQYPDLILLDIRMPGMDGLSMLTELRKDLYGKSVKVIILTNLELDDKILQNVLKNEPTYYFVKSDIQIAELIEKIKETFLSYKTSK